MENGPPTNGFEDGTIDVERLLVEPQDEHVSVDNVLCFNEKIPHNDMDMEEVSCCFDVSNTGIAQEREDILNGDVLDPMHNEVGDFRLQNDFCSMGDEYLLGVEFAESITNLDYGSSEGFQSCLASSPHIDQNPWKSDIFRITEIPQCESDHLHVSASGFGEIPNHCHESETLAEERLSKPSISCALPDITKFHDISSCSFQDILSDENDASQSPSAEIHHSPKKENNDEFGQSSETKRFQAQNALVAATLVPTQKRSRKPTQRYIDELADPILKHPKKRREVSSPTVKDKSVGVKDHKKCHMGPKATRLPDEESSVKAIQVPFASLAHKESPKSPSYDIVCYSDKGNLLNKSRVTPEIQRKWEESSLAIHPKKKDDGLPAASQRKRDDSIITTHTKKRENRITAPIQKKRRDYAVAVSPKKKENRLITVRKRKREDDYFYADSSEEVSGKRKHHRLWTIAEVRKLIDGVSEYGVGRWSRIKKLFFSASAHRTSVDLKDKWRNLLKASGIQGQGSREGEKKRNLAWRPLPKSILHRVCELASMYPYPKGRKSMIGNSRNDSPDRSTDITLNDYRRILRSINGN